MWLLDGNVLVALAIDTHVFHERARQWFDNDGFSYREVPHAGLVGLTQVTDAWLAELARRYKAQLATLDASLIAMHPDVGFLIPA